MDLGCVLAELAPATIRSLNSALPTIWSRTNPVDIIGDAPPERYRTAVEAVAADPAVDVLIVMNCPTGLASPVEAAHAVVSATSSGPVLNKPVLTCWLGGQAAREGRRVLIEAGLASFDTPSDVATAMSYLGNWSQGARRSGARPRRREQRCRAGQAGRACDLSRCCRRGAAHADGTGGQGGHCRLWYSRA